MTKKILLLAAALGGATPALAAPEPTQFTRDGVRYEYRVETRGEHQLLVGRVLSTGEPFELRVAPNGWVRGRVGDRPVLFRTSAGKAAALASR